MHPEIIATRDLVQRILKNQEEDDRQGKKGPSVNHMHWEERGSQGEEGVILKPPRQWGQD